MEKVKVYSILKRVREENPLIHNITNVVVANFSANGLLAIGASPVMANAIEEVADMTKGSDALVLNIGMLNKENLEAMLLAGKSANKHGIPVILDPVGVGTTSFRSLAAAQLLKEVKIAVIRGNAPEIANLIGEKGNLKGVDAKTFHGDRKMLAERAASHLNTVIAITGKDDFLSDGMKTYMVHNGDPILTKVTGTGCLLSAIIGAFAAVEKNNYLEASVAALVFYGVAAEIASQKTEEQGTASFQIQFINQLGLVSSSEIDLYGSYEKQ